MRRVGLGLLLLACCGEREPPGKAWWDRARAAVAAADADRIADLILAPDAAEKVRAFMADHPDEFARLAEEIRAHRYLKEREVDLDVVESRLLGVMRVPADARPEDVPSLGRERGVLCTVATPEGNEVNLVLVREGDALRLDLRPLFMQQRVSYEAPERIVVATAPERLAWDGLDETYAYRGGFWLAKLSRETAGGEPRLVALATVCTRLGARPNWLEDDGVIVCPACGSRYGRDGRRLAGPAPRSLDRYAIARDANGKIVVDKTRTFHFEDGGWADPSSYVPLPEGD